MARGSWANSKTAKLIAAIRDDMPETSAELAARVRTQGLNIDASEASRLLSVRAKGAGGIEKVEGRWRRCEIVKKPVEVSATGCTTPAQAIRRGLDSAGLVSLEARIDAALKQQDKAQTKRDKGPRPQIAAPRTPPPFKPLLPAGVMVRPGALEFLGWPSRMGEQRLAHRGMGAVASAKEAERKRPAGFESPGAALGAIKGFSTKGV